MYHVFPSNRYQKSLKRISRHKDFNVKRLDEVVALLESGEILNQKYKDHELEGEFAGVRECHIQNDILFCIVKKKTYSFLF